MPATIATTSSSSLIPSWSRTCSWNSSLSSGSDHLRLDTLQRVNGSYTSDSGENRRQDIVWKVCLHDRWLYVYLLLEFQSTPDRWMALRMHAYISLLLQDLQRQNQLSDDRKLPPVLPVVLYNGVRNWDCGTELADLIANAPGWLEPLQPAQRYLVVDAGVHSHESRDTKSNLVAALFRLEHSRTPDDLKRVLRSLNEWLADPQCASLRRDFSRFASWQLRRKVNDRTIPETADLQEIPACLKNDNWTRWEQWKQEGIEEGRREGKLEGKSEANSKAYSKVNSKAYSKGCAKANAKASWRVRRDCCNSSWRSVSILCRPGPTSG